MKRINWEGHFNGVKRWTFRFILLTKLIVVASAMLTFIYILTGVGVDAFSIIAKYLKLSGQELLVAVFMLYYLSKEVR